MSRETFDVVVVGAGVAGALTAKRLTEAGLRVLILEAGPSSPQSQSGYDQHLRTFYEAFAKGPESAWPAHPNAPQADTGDIQHNNGYFVQHGPDAYGSSYTRAQGGSTLHWLGVSLRMLPEDFQMRSRHGVGRDWPIGYDELEPYYRKAEFEMGVSADVADQAYHGITFAPGYDYPMHKVPQSYSDTTLGSLVDGKMVKLGDQQVAVKVRSYPAARNSIPRGSYAPIGAVDTRESGHLTDPEMGERCQGNTSCTPICPVQAKYHAGKSLARANRDNLEIRARAVASRINVDPATGMVKSITYQRYEDGPGHTVHEATARAYVLAAHAVENAKLMLSSNLGVEKDVIGRHLMDHPTLYAWGLSPVPVHPYRGPLSTSGIEELRGGAFRARHAAFRFDIGNDGWRAPTGAPDSLVVDEVMKGRRFGNELRQRLASSLSRQVRCSIAIEQLPDRGNRVTLDRRFVDPLGNPRPAIHYKVGEYTMAGMAAAADVGRQLFRIAGIEDHSGDEGKWFPSVKFGGVVYRYHGMGHFAGTHLMGASAADSVLDSNQRCWEHPNLYMVGSGSFPTMGTSNPTLTIGALAIRTAEHLARELGARI